MHPRARHLIQHLELAPHPEGGFYREIHRSGEIVSRASDAARRTAITSIYFLLPQGACSRWHRVSADEAWHHYEGDPVELLSFSGDGSQARVVRLGPIDHDASPVHVVPAGWWQAARSLGAYSLTGCTVGPGFEFVDFDILADLPHQERPDVPDIDTFHTYL